MISTQEIIKHIEKLGFKYRGTATKVKNTLIFETTEKGVKQRGDQLQMIANVLNGAFLAKSAQSKAGETTVGMHRIILKPNAKAGGATEQLKITTTNLIKGGVRERFEWSGLEFDAFTFTSSRQMHTSILRALEQNSNVDPMVITFVRDQLLENRKFVWPVDIEQYVKNELGKYLGEMLLGYYALEGHWPKKVAKVVFPNDPTFSAIDSLIVAEDGELYPISSKFGAGANASFFANILPKGIQYKKKIPLGIFKDIIDITARLNITKPEREGTRITMEYGIREILKIPESLIHNTMDVFAEVRKGNYLDHRVAEVSAAVQRLSKNDAVLKNLPHSISGFFSREIAAKLNADQKSVDAMKNILAGKAFYQANLQISAWNRGEFDVKLTKTNGIELVIAGNKSALTDIYQKQGIINYMIRSV